MGFYVFFKSMYLLCKTSFIFSSEGPGMFCRNGKLGDQREAWEEKRTSLRDVLDLYK